MQPPTKKVPWWTSQQSDSRYAQSKRNAAFRKANPKKAKEMDEKYREWYYKGGKRDFETTSEAATGLLPKEARGGVKDLSEEDPKKKKKVPWKTDAR